MKTFFSILFLGLVAKASAPVVIQNPLLYAQIQTKNFAQGDTGTISIWNGCTGQVYSSGGLSIDCSGTAEHTTRSGLLVTQAFYCTFDFQEIDKNSDDSLLKNESCQ